MSTALATIVAEEVREAFGLNQSVSEAIVAAANAPSVRSLAAKKAAETRKRNKMTQTPQNVVETQGVPSTRATEAFVLPGESETRLWGMGIVRRRLSDELDILFGRVNRVLGTRYSSKLENLSVFDWGTTGQYCRSISANILSRRFSPRLRDNQEDPDLAVDMAGMDALIRRVDGNGWQARDLVYVIQVIDRVPARVAAETLRKEVAAVKAENEKRFQAQWSAQGLKTAEQRLEAYDKQRK